MVPIQVNAANCVIGPLDYTTAATCLAHNTPYAYMSRNEGGSDAMLCSLLQRSGLGLEVSRGSWQTGQWQQTLQQSLSVTAAYR